jgi:hypothetical protein
VPTVVLNQDFGPLKKYEAGRIKRHKEATLDQARDRYAVGVGVGLLVLEAPARAPAASGSGSACSFLVRSRSFSRPPIGDIAADKRLGNGKSLEARQRLKPVE